MTRRGKAARRPRMSPMLAFFSRFSPVCSGRPDIYTRQEDEGGRESQLRGGDSTYRLGCESQANLRGWRFSDVVYPRRRLSMVV